MIYDEKTYKQLTTSTDGCHMYAVDGIPALVDYFSRSAKCTSVDLTYQNLKNSFCYFCSVKGLSSSEEIKYILIFACRKGDSSFVLKIPRFGGFDL